MTNQTDAEPRPISTQHIAVALSGGGHRATLFGLGALLYLVDAGKGPEIGSVSSVSGGSLANAYVGLNADLTTVTAEAFRQAVKPLAVAAATGGTVWARTLTYLYLALMLLILAAASWLCFPLGGAWPVLVWVGALALVGWLAQRRSWIARRAFDAVLFHGAPLSAMHTNVEHVLTACDLQTAEQCYFSGRFVHSFRLGWGVPGDASLAWAAQASACPPGAFAPVTRPTAGHGFTTSRPEAPQRFLLVDGGVYDNMATEWPLRLFDRLAEGTPPSPPIAVPDEVLVVNASAAKGVAKRGSATIPLLGELTSVIADKDVLYDQTTATRRRLLDTRFRIARRAREQGAKDGGDGAFDGAQIQIDRSPFSLPKQFAREPGSAHDDDYSQRARAVIGKLGPATEHDWQLQADANRNVATKLSKIEAARAAWLLKHAYALTMANAHVLMEYPLLDLPPDEHFLQLVR